MSKVLARTPILILACSLFLAGGNALAGHWSDFPYSVYIESSTSPMSIKGMSDVHVSDWETYGTGTSEGRMSLPLSEGNTTNPLLPGAKVGVAIDVAPFLDLNLDFSANFGNMTVLTATAGADIYLVELEHFRMGGMARMGVMLASMSAGSAQVLPGKTPPVIISSVGTFNTGDPISAELTGIVTQAGIVNEFYFRPDVGLRLEAGFQYAYISSLKITSGVGNNKIELPVDHAAVVEPTEGSTTQANIAPQGQSLGLTAGIGLVFRY